MDPNYTRSSDSLSSLQKYSLPSKIHHLTSTHTIDQLVTLPNGSSSSRNHHPSSSKNSIIPDSAKNKGYTSALVSPKSISNSNRQLFMKRMNSQTSTTKKADSSIDNSGFRSTDQKHNSSTENEEYHLKKNMKIRLVSQTRISTKETDTPDREPPAIIKRPSHHVLNPESTSQVSIPKNSIISLDHSSSKNLDYSDLSSPSKISVPNIIKSSIRNGMKKTLDPGHLSKEAIKSEYSSEPFDSKIGQYSASKTKNDMLLSRIASSGFFKPKPLITDSDPKDRHMMHPTHNSPVERVAMFSVNVNSLMSPKSVKNSESYGFQRSDKNFSKRDAKRNEQSDSILNSRNNDYSSSFDKQPITSVKSLDNRKMNAPTEADTKLLNKHLNRSNANTKPNSDASLSSISTKATLKSKSKDNMFPLKFQKSKSEVESAFKGEKHAIKEVVSFTDLSISKKLYSPRNKRVFSPPSQSIERAVESNMHFATEPDDREYIASIHQTLDRRIYPLSSKHSDQKQIDFELENLEKLRPPGVGVKTTKDKSYSAERKFFLANGNEKTRPSLGQNSLKLELEQEDFDLKLATMQKKKQNLIDDYQKLDQLRKSIEGNQKAFQEEEIKEARSVDHCDKSKQEYVAGLENSLKVLFMRVKNVLGEYKQSKEDWALERREMQEKILRLESRISELEVRKTL